MKSDTKTKPEPTQVFCMRCTANKRKDGEEMIVETIPDGSIVIENAALSLTFDEDTKLLSTITHKATGRVENVQVSLKNLARHISTLFRTHHKMLGTVGIGIPDMLKQSKPVLLKNGSNFECHLFLNN